MMDHLDGPTLIVTKLPDGGVAWTVIRPTAMEISGGWHGVRLKLEGSVMSGDWRYGPPPDDWEHATDELPAARMKSLPEPRRLLPGGG